MVYSLRRIGEPRAFTAIEGVIDTDYSEKLLYVVIGVEPVCELLSIFGKHFTEFELDLPWLFETAMFKATNTEAYADAVSELLDWVGDDGEQHTLLELVDVASACISNNLPALTSKQILGLQYAGYRYGKIALAITPVL